MTEKNAQLEAGLASDLNRELDVVEDEIMCVWFDNTEISHLLGSHINDMGNMESWQDCACVKGAETIDKLRAEVKRLRDYNNKLLQVIKEAQKEAVYLFSATCGECKEAENIIDLTSTIVKYNPLE